MRLIDADALIEELHYALDESGFDEDYIDMGIDDFIQNQPTAYDSDKVDSQILEYFKGVIEKKLDSWDIVEFSKDIREIVRKGGVEEYAININVRSNGWIPVNPDDKSTFPPNDNYILLSFSNFDIPVVGRYEVDAAGGAFYCGDEDETLASQDMFVNAWKHLPQPYRERQE